MSCLACSLIALSLSMRSICSSSHFLRFCSYFAMSSTSHCGSFSLTSWVVRVNRLSDSTLPSECSLEFSSCQKKRFGRSVKEKATQSQNNQTQNTSLQPTYHWIIIIITVIIITSSSSSSSSAVLLYRPGYYHTFHYNVVVATISWNANL